MRTVPALYAVWWVRPPLRPASLIPLGLPLDSVLWPRPLTGPRQQRPSSTHRGQSPPVSARQTDPNTPSSKNARALTPRAFLDLQSAYQAHCDASPLPPLAPATWSRLCSPLLTKPSAAQLPTWQLVQHAAATASSLPLVLSSLNDLLPLYTRSARRGDQAIVHQIQAYCRCHFPTHPRTLAMARVDPLFFKVMVASVGDVGKHLLKATGALELWIRDHARGGMEPAHVAFYLSLVPKHASKAAVESLITAVVGVGISSRPDMSPVVASALVALYSRTGSPATALHIWDSWMAASASSTRPARAELSASMVAAYCDLLGHHAPRIPDAHARLLAVQAALASPSPPFTPSLATNANLWTSLVEAAIRADLPDLVVPILQEMRANLHCPDDDPRRRPVFRKAVMTVGTLIKQHLAAQRWDKEKREAIEQEVGLYMRQGRSVRPRSHGHRRSGSGSGAGRGKRECGDNELVGS